MTSLAHQESSAATEPRVIVRPSVYKQKGRVKTSTVVVYSSVFTLLIAVIAIGYRAPSEIIVASTSTLPLNSEMIVDQDDHDKLTNVDYVLATDIAANAATTLNLSVAPSVSSMAISAKIDSELAMSNGTTITKPVMVQGSSTSRSIISYTVLEGDTVDSLATKFAITADTIKFANNLTTNSPILGTVLEILPRDGLVYVVKNGDTAQSIAQQYKVDASTITSYNDLEISGYTTGLKIILPGGTLPASERPGYITSSLQQVAGYSSGYTGNAKTWRIKSGTSMIAGNNYAIGNCTAYVFDRREEIGNPVRPSWGNASSWAMSARAAGYRVDNNPSVGAVIQNGGGAGHVAIVEEILPNGDLSLSEMNASFGSVGGWNIVSGRILPASVVAQYLYIH